MSLSIFTYEARSTPGGTRNLGSLRSSRTPGATLISARCLGEKESRHCHRASTSPLGAQTFVSIGSLCGEGIRTKIWPNSIGLCEAFRWCILSLSQLLCARVVLLLEL